MMPNNKKIGKKKTIMAKTVHTTPFFIMVLLYFMIVRIANTNGDLYLRIVFTSNPIDPTGWFYFQFANVSNGPTVYQIGSAGNTMYPVVSL